jgi:putative FmdB family regulatory protein
MPTYEYRCEACDRTFDVVQSFHDDPLTSCPTCDSPVRKVFGNVGIVFKGSGFYKTDSRNGQSAKESRKDTADASSGPAEKSSGDQGGSDHRAPSPDGSPDKPSAPSSAKEPSSKSDSTSGGKKSEPAPASTS